MVCNHLKRLPIFFVHCQEEQRKHDHNHTQCCQTDIARRFEQKEKRHSDERRCPKANELSFCQVKEHLRFYPRQVTRNRNICCQLYHLHFWQLHTVRSFISPDIPTFCFLSCKQFNTWNISHKFYNFIPGYIRFFTMLFNRRNDKLVY